DDPAVHGSRKDFGVFSFCQRNAQFFHKSAKMGVVIFVQYSSYLFPVIPVMTGKLPDIAAVSQVAPAASCHEKFRTGPRRSFKDHSPVIKGASAYEAGSAGPYNDHVFIHFPILLRSDRNRYRQARRWF